MQIAYSARRRAARGDRPREVAPQGAAARKALWYSKPVVKEWLSRHREFRLVFLPAYSPNLNLIERLWKFLRKKALNRWHETFEAMQGAVAEVLDHLDRYRPELDSLMTEEFHILKDEELPLAPAA